MQSIVLEHALWQGAQFCCHVRPYDISSLSKCILTKILCYFSVDKDSANSALNFHSLGQSFHISSL